MSEQPETEYPDVEVQNLPEGEAPEDPDHPDWHPDLPDADSDEWQAQIALDDEEQA